MSILQMSISGTILIVVVFALRALTLNTLPKKTFLVLWGVVILRLALPFSIPSHLSIYSWLHMPAQVSKVTADMRIDMSTDSIAEKVIGTLNTGLFGIAKLNKNGLSISTPTLSLFLLIWLLGIVACAIFFTVTYFRCHREFRTALPVECDFITGWKRNHPTILPIKIKQSNRIKAPLAYGILRPTILIPQETDLTEEKKLEYILIHEYVHIKRLDALTKLLLISVVCIHWFNPFVWVMCLLANRDIELSCDETVVKKVGESSRSAYALTLISLEETKSRRTLLFNNFSKNAIEERIIAIMKIKKHSITVITTAVLLVIGVTIGFTTSNVTAENDPDVQYDADISAAAPPAVENSPENAAVPSDQLSTDNTDSEPIKSSSAENNLARDDDSYNIQENDQLTELKSNENGIIISKRYYPITEENLLTRYDSNTDTSMVSFDDGNTWMFRYFDTETNTALYSTDGKTWGMAPTS